MLIPPKRYKLLSDFKEPIDVGIYISGKVQKSKRPQVMSPLGSQGTLIDEN